MSEHSDIYPPNGASDENHMRWREARALYERIMSYSPMMVFRLAPDGSVLYVNATVAQATGYTPDELLGSNWWEVFFPGERQAEGERLRRELLAGDITGAEWDLTLRDDTRVALRVSSANLYDAHGRLERTLAFGFNVTERQRAEAALALAQEEVVRANRAKDEFLAAMSHELRTPLGAILGTTEVLQEGIHGVLNEKQLGSLRMIETSARHLLELINDILDLSKVAAGKLDLQIGLVGIQSLCQASLQFVRQAAFSKRIQLFLSLDDRIGTVLADERRLKQVLVNLLSNAVKFTPEGGTVGLEVAGDAGDHAVRFTVWDTGVGIAPPDLARLFKPFTQVDSRLTRAANSGTGLGLALVQRLVELHGGSVGVESAPGQGSRFSVWLPRRSSIGAEREAEASAAMPASPVTPERPSARRALIVEDLPVAAEQLVRYLGELGIETSVYPRAEGALRHALAVRPDVIILDIMLPGSSGWALLERLKGDTRAREIPVVIVSVTDEKRRGMALGAADVLVKPITREDLRHALGRLGPAGSTRPPPGEDEPEPDEPLVLLADDSPVTIDLLTDYLSAHGYRVMVARNGAEALERAASEPPALILMDIQMPGLDGLEAIRRLRADPQLAAIPVIALTALVMPGDRERCLAAGADDYLSKPIRLRALVEAMAGLLRRVGDAQGSAQPRG